MRGCIPAGLVVTVVLLGAAAPLRAQSLADVAKKEEERRKSLATKSDKANGGKVFTNKDLKGVPPAPAPTADAGADKSNEPAGQDAKDAGDASKSAADAASKGKADVKDQAYWSRRMSGLREQLRRDQMFADALQTRINALTTDFANRDDPAQRAKIGVDRQNALDELERLKKSIDEDTKAIADAEEEARRSSVPPGWLR